MAYTTIDDPQLYFDTTLYTGNQSTVTLTMDNIGLLWMKRRDDGIRHCLFDSVRGGHYTGSGSPPLLESNSNAAAQGTDIDSAAKGITFGATQTVIGNDSAGWSYNRTGHSMVGWQWSTGTSFSNDASATGVGSIDSSGSVSTTAGFSIISWTGSGSGATIAHGLGAQPQIVFVKNRDDTASWNVYTVIGGGGKGLFLNENNGFDSDTSYFNNGTASTTTFPVGTANTANGSSDNMIAYCFANVKGYSKIGSFVGNNSSNGTFVYLGFRPAWVMIKRTDSTGATHDWFIFDNKRNTGNPNDDYLEANETSTETTSGRNVIDFLSNGFKCRQAYDDFNASGSTQIYMAFAEAPFVNSNGVPTTAA